MFRYLSDSGSVRASTDFNYGRTDTYPLLHRLTGMGCTHARAIPQSLYRRHRFVFPSFDFIILKRELSTMPMCRRRYIRDQYEYRRSYSPTRLSVTLRTPSHSPLGTLVFVCYLSHVSANVRALRRPKLTLRRAAIRSLFLPCAAISLSSCYAHSWLSCCASALRRYKIRLFTLCARCTAYDARHPS